MLVSKCAVSIEAEGAKRISHDSSRNLSSKDRPMFPGKQAILVVYQGFAPKEAVNTIESVDIAANEPTPEACIRTQIHHLSGMLLQGFCHEVESARPGGGCLAHPSDLRSQFSCFTPEMIDFANAY